MTPRPYLSFSQMTTFEMSPEKFLERYIYEEKERISRNMQYGSMLAKGLEFEEATGDPFLDLVMERLPKFERMDLPVEDPKGFEVEVNRKGVKMKVKVPVLKDKDGNIPILALPDTAKVDYSAFKEYKTSVQGWTQRKADESGQISFYATAMWLATGKIPNDIELINAKVEYQEDGSLVPTGEILQFRTRRHMTDIIKMTLRMRKAWAGIKELCSNEIL